jgi:putative ABC transport system permease protein
VPAFNLFSLALKNLKRKSLRTGILVLSIGLLVSILVFGSSFIVSVSASLKKSINRLGADILVVPPGARDYAEEVLLETKTKTFYMDRSVMDRVKQVDGVAEVTPQVYLTTIMGTCCDVPEAKVVAFNQDTDFIVTPWLKKSIGRKLRPGEAIIGWLANENLGLLEVKKATLFGNNFKIVGVLQKSDTGLDNAIFISDENLPEVLANGRSSLKPNQISLLLVKVKDGMDPRKVSRAIEGSMVDVDVTYRNDLGKGILSTLRDINRVFLLTISLALLLSIFLTWTIFSAIVNERMKEVGIMRAIGAKNRHIMKAFVLEVLVLGLAGSVAGIILGTYLSLSLSRIFTLLRDLGAGLTILQRAEIGLLGIITGTAVCVLGALAPVLRVKQTEPLNAIKEA